jgi:putative ABC transport system permease protein
VNFILKMAWRDSRASRRRLLLLSLSVVFGIGALVAMGSVIANLRRAVDGQANSLLGADLVVSGTIPTAPDWGPALEALHGEVGRERIFPAQVVANGVSRRAQMRALEGNFPFYGEFVTIPADAPARLRQGGPVIILAGVLMDQLHVHVGDSLQVGIGQEAFTVIGEMKTFPGELTGFNTHPPLAFIPFSSLSRKMGSAATRVNVKLPAGADSEAAVKALKAKFGDDRLIYATAEQQRKNMGQALTGFDAFFRLVGFVALFLGAIGVASVVHVYVRQKITTVAILRCLGATAGQTFAVYLLQGLALGLFGSIVGAAIGLAAQWLLPRMLSDIIPFKIEFFISWPAVASGMTSGLVICLLFTLLPLLSVRRVPPLAAIRSALAERAATAFDPWRIVIVLLIPVAVAGFAIWQTGNVRFGIGYAVTLGLGFGILAGTAFVVSWAAKKWFPRHLPYIVRQGVANLHRPNNRTVLLLLSIGLGAFLMIALFLARTELLDQIRGPAGGSMPNLIFGRVEEDQMEPLARIAAAQGAPIVQQNPFVRMTLVSVNGHPPGRQWLQPNGKPREVIASYRDHLLDNEKVGEGTYVPRTVPGSAEVPIALSPLLRRPRAGEPPRAAGGTPDRPGVHVAVGPANKPAGPLESPDLLRVGDILEWDVQGIPMRTRIAAVLVPSARFNLNLERYDVLFPDGAINGAPKFYLAGAHATTAAIALNVQQAVFAAFPKMQVADISMIVDTISRIFGKIAFVIGFMASFIIATGVIMLVSAILTGRFQRIRETVLLRTLGASHRQLLQIQLVEYAILGVLASLVGAILAVGGNALLAHFVFKIPPSAPPLLLLGCTAAVTAVTLVTGWFTNRGITNHPPLVVLRQET